MKIMKGTSRTVIRVGNLAFKFPRYIFTMKQLWKYRELKSSKKVFLVQLLNGFISNFTELGVWLICKSPVLAPTYFTIGFFSIQKFIVGVKPDLDQLSIRFRALSEKAKFQRIQVGGHGFDPANFIETNEGLVMVDYGGSLTNNSGSLTSWIMNHCKELEQVLGNYKTPSE